MTRQSKDRSFEAVITKVERKGTSRMGNPSFRVFLDNEAVLVTKTDTAVAYEIENSENIGVPVTITVNGRNEVWNVEPLTPAEPARRQAITVQAQQARGRAI